MHAFRNLFVDEVAGYSIGSLVYPLSRGAWTFSLLGKTTSNTRQLSRQVWYQQWLNQRDL